MAPCSPGCTRARALDKAKDDSAGRRGCCAEVGAEYLVHLPEQYTDQHGGAPPGRATSTPTVEEPRPRHGRAGPVPVNEYGVKLVFHPHADTHVDTQVRVERFLAGHRPELVNLCFDTGHMSYCEGNNVEIIERLPERITYVHLKSGRPRRPGPRAERKGCRSSESVKLGSCASRPMGSRIRY